MATSSDGSGTAGLAVGAAVGASHVAESEGAGDEAGVAAAAFVGTAEAEPPAQTLPPTTAATRPMTTIAAAATARVLRGPRWRLRPRRGWFADCMRPSYRPQ